MKKNLRAAALLLVGITLLSGCSMLTANGRREHAYARYVQKSSLGRVKQQKKLRPQKVKIPETQPSEPVIATEASGSGPQSVSDGSRQ
jgi:hypothetical protein